MKDDIFPMFSSILENCLVFHIILFIVVIMKNAKQLMQFSRKICTSNVNEANLFCLFRALKKC